MLCVGPGSKCDVCLESFGEDLKAPCSVDCGHVFCVDCLNHITRPTCPLCRMQFEVGTYVKLHVDLDSIRNASRGTEPITIPLGGVVYRPLTAEQEARRLQEAIAKAANEGSNEPGLRNLISECKVFLMGQPREYFQDLRVSLRMIAYLYEIKKQLKQQEGKVESLNAEVAHVQNERMQLKERLNQVEHERKEERERALETEKILRRHCEQTQEAYQKLVQLYNEVIFKVFVSRQNDGSAESLDLSALSLPPASIDLRPQQGAESSSAEFLMSPLPEFTSNSFTSMLGPFVALPEIEYDEKSKGLQIPILGACGEPGCPVACSCSASLFKQEKVVVTPQNTTDRSSLHPLTNSGMRPSLLSMTAPAMNSTGCRSERSPPLSCNAPPPLSSSPSTDSDSSSLQSVPPHSSGTTGSVRQYGDPDALRNRFHELLRETRLHETRDGRTASFSGLSSSIPRSLPFTSGTPASLTREQVPNAIQPLPNTSRPSSRPDPAESSDPISARQLPQLTIPFEHGSETSEPSSSIPQSNEKLSVASIAAQNYHLEKERRKAGKERENAQVLVNSQTERARQNLSPPIAVPRGSSPTEGSSFSRRGSYTADGDRSSRVQHSGTNYPSSLSSAAHRERLTDNIRQTPEHSNSSAVPPSTHSSRERELTGRSNKQAYPLSTSGTTMASTSSPASQHRTSSRPAAPHPRQIHDTGSLGKSKAQAMLASYHNQIPA